MLKRFFISMLGTMAGLWLSVIILAIAGFIGIVAAIGSFSSETTVKIKKNSILYINLTGNIEDRYQPKSFIQMVQQAEDKAPTLEDMILSLNAAKDDNDIEGLYIYCGGAGMGMASREELINAIANFKQSGKWVYAYADNYSQGDYIIASSADAVALNPVGAIDVHGMGSMTPFFKDLLDKVGVKMQIIKVGTYKSAVEPFILTSMSQPAREQMQQYVDSLWAYASEEIAYGRNIPVDTVKAMASEIIFTNPASFFTGSHLADTLMYERQFDNELKTLTDIDPDKDLRLVTPADYVSSKNLAKNTTGKEHIAVLYAIGDISDSGREGIVGSEMVSEIVDLADDDDVAGMVFRVNSPGGSAFASEQIWEALQYFKSKGKPLYVSMGDYAASGGYYISCCADSIFADRTTITGSIGVFGMIPDFSGLVSEKLGIHFSTVETNPNGVGVTAMEAMTPAQYAAMQRSVEDIYDLFTSRVADGRNLEKDYVKTIAEGRVWIAGDAIKLGLVDGIADLNEVISYMAEDLMIKADRIARYPNSDEKMWEVFMREYGDIEQFRLAGFDSETLRLIETVRKIRQDSHIQARMEYVILR